MALISNPFAKMDSVSFDDFRKRTQRPKVPETAAVKQWPVDTDAIVKRSSNILKNFKPPGKGN